MDPPNQEVDSSSHARMAEVMPDPTDMEADEHEEERHNYALLCRLMVDVVPAVMRRIFDGIHTPINLVSTLAKPTVHTSLRRLRIHGIIEETQWELLYPLRKKQANSARYDPMLLQILLRTICPLSPPYPNGWDGVPLEMDKSTSADLTRMLWYRKLISCREQEIRDKDFQSLWSMISEVILRLGGALFKSPIVAMKEEMMDPSVQKQYVKALLEWQDKADVAAAKEEEIDNLVKMRKSNHDLRQLSQMSFNYISAGAQAQTGNRVTLQNDSNSASNVSGKAKSAPTVSGHMMREDEATEQELAKMEKNILSKHWKQLTETIRCEDIVSRLVQRSVLSHEEKNKISLATRNTERMTMILDIISKKSHRAFDVFCDVIKFKYKGLYDQIMQDKKAPTLSNKPDEVSQCANALKLFYTAVLGKYCPIPWYDDVEVPINEFFTQCYVTDSYGRDLAPGEVFDGHPRCEKPRRVLLQGQAGSGKTAFCKYLAHEWARGNITFSKRYRLVFLIDLKWARNDLVETIMDQCLPPHFRKTKDEMRSLLTTHDDEILYILDGYEDLVASVDSEFADLIHKKSLQNSGLLLALDQRYVTSAISRTSDSKLYLQGLQPGYQEELIKNYIKASEASTEFFNGLLTRVLSDQDLNTKALSLIPMHCICLCLLAEMQCNLDFTTPSFLLQNFIPAIQKLYCLRHGLEISEDHIPDSVTTTVTTLEAIAFQTLLANRSVMDTELLLKEHSTEYDSPDLLNFGLMERFVTGGRSRPTEYCCFANRLFKEIMAARYMAKMDIDDFNRYKDVLVSQKQMHGVCAFFSGLLRFDYNLRTMKELFAILGGMNKTIWRDAADEKATISSHKPECRLSNIQLSMECLYECESRKDVVSFVTDSLPRKIVMRHKDTHSFQMTGGLAQVINANSENVTDLDIRLDHFGIYHEQAILTLAQSIAKSNYISSLKIRWTSDYLFALFLANVFGESTAVRTLQIYDDSKSMEDNISATVWSNLRLGCSNMQQVKSLAFIQCKNPSMVTSVVRNSPNTMEELFLNGCTIDLICAQELSNKIEKGTNLRLLNLSSITIKRPDFNHVAAGLKVTRTLSELLLSDSNLDPDSLIALAEGLKFNTSLKRVDLSKNAISDEACKALSYALTMNKSILQVSLLNCKVSEEGGRIIRREKRQNVVILGFEEKRIRSRYRTRPIKSS